MCERGPRLKRKNSIPRYAAAAAGIVCPNSADFARPPPLRACLFSARPRDLIYHPLFRLLSLSSLSLSLSPSLSHSLSLSLSLSLPLSLTLSLSLSLSLLSLSLSFSPGLFLCKIAVRDTKAWLAAGCCLCRCRKLMAVDLPGILLVKIHITLGVIMKRWLIWKKLSVFNTMSRNIL